LFGQRQIQPLRIGVRRFAGQGRKVTAQATQEAGFAGSLCAYNGNQAGAEWLNFGHAA
jgi:hypothetical protein